MRYDEQTPNYGYGLKKQYIIISNILSFKKYQALPGPYFPKKPAQKL